MKYFKNITDFEQAKKRYRKLALQLHPDVGGSPAEFQAMQKEYKTLLLNLQQQPTILSDKQNELLSELGKLAKVLIENQVPQTFLKGRIEKSKTPLEKSLYSGIIKILDEFV